MNDEPCDYVSGNWSNGCYDGYLGTRCNTCMKLSIKLPLWFCYVGFFSEMLFVDND